MIMECLFRGIIFQKGFVFVCLFVCFFVCFGCILDMSTESFLNVYYIRTRILEMFIVIRTQSQFNVVCLLGCNH